MTKIFTIALLSTSMLAAAQGSLPSDCLVDALDAATWERSEWISAEDALVIEGKVGFSIAITG